MTSLQKAAALSAAATLAGLADFLFLVQPSTGYALTGPALARYLLLALCTAVLAAVIWRAPLAQTPPAVPRSGIWLVCALFFAVGAGFCVAGKLTLPRLLLGAGYLVCCAFFVLLFCGKRSFGLSCGATGALLLACLLRYLLRPASRQHIFFTIGLLASIFGLLFGTAWLRALFLPAAANRRPLAFFGWLTALTGGGLALAKYAAFAIHGSFAAAQPMYDLPLFGLALAGVFCAKEALSAPEGNPQPTTEEH